MRGAIGILVFLGCCGASSSALAFRCKKSERHDYVSLHWDRRTIQIGIRRGAPADIVSEVVNSFGAWSVQPCTDLDFDYVGIVEEGDPENQVAYIKEHWVDGVDALDERGRDGDAIALTQTTYSLETGIIRRATIEINDQIFDFESVVDLEKCRNKYDLTAVITHEVGHFIGLDHTDVIAEKLEDAPTMSLAVGPCELDKISLADDDIAGLCLLYPKGRPAGHCYPLPAITSGSYVSTMPFGCTASRMRTAHALSTMVLLFFAAIVARLRARRER